jgi:serine phosphatase RsbU (regulator of sigma subunit)/CHASE2 domain-containing sensor protein
MATRARRRIYVIGAAVLAVLTALIWITPPWHVPLQAAWFDTYQTIAPREIASTQVVVVEIDEQSLAAVGQWPWPRTRLAELIDTIAKAHPAAIGVDILMPEADPLPPERLVDRMAQMAPGLANERTRQISNDTVLARSIAASPTVLAIAGTPDTTQLTLRTTPISLSAAEGSGAMAPDATGLAHYTDVLASREEIDRAATGHGLISVEPAAGVIRSIPLVAEIHGTLVPALSVEMLRIAKGRPKLKLSALGSEARRITIGDLSVPTEADGSVRVYYSPRSAQRMVSALDVLQGRVAADRLEDKLVLIGVTGIGLLEYQSTPLGERMPGVEIHAQLLENLYDQTLLNRPTWGRYLEALLFLLLGALLIFATPRWTPRNAALLAVACVVALAALGYLLFRTERILFDAAIPGISLTLLFAVLLVLTLTEANRQQRSLERLVHRQREEGARLAGELEAARRIQTASLPSTELLRDEPRIDLAAVMVPAREVGGDLYDFFYLDANRLFILAGDVAGKGLTASIFMAVSKALYKSAMLRDPRADIGDIMTSANAEISRDNPEMMFVTVFAAILHLESGELDYCNAGHDNPYLLARGGSSAIRLENGGGPPLCTVDDFAYGGARVRLGAGDLLCICTDGVTEARNLEGAMYGDARLREILLKANKANAAASAVLAAVREDLAHFCAGAEQVDDYTVFLLRWNGGGAQR